MKLHVFAYFPAKVRACVATNERLFTLQGGSLYVPFRTPACEPVPMVEVAVICPPVSSTVNFTVLEALSMVPVRE